MPSTNTSKSPVLPLVQFAGWSCASMGTEMQEELRGKDKDRHFEKDKEVGNSRT